MTFTRALSQTSVRLSNRVIPWAIVVCLTLAYVTPIFGRELPGPATALRNYVAKPDSSYAYKVRREGTLGKVQYAELILTSQTWRDIPWKHQLFILHPSSTLERCQHACLFISGGSWKDELDQPAKDDSLPDEVMLLAVAAEQMRTPLAILRHVPHQPMFGDKKEDQIIALTFEEYMRSKDEEWPLLLPMVKSAVRAMDATTEVCNSKWNCDLQAFTVTGASKRGWTTWLTGAVDERAKALAPMVIDVLNMQAHMELQKKSWGEYSEQINDYTERNLQDHLVSEQGLELRRIVDPYHYLGTMHQPKLLFIGTNDRYWPVDALNLYWDQIQGDENYILYVPNNGHGLKDMRRVVGSLVAFHHHASGQRKLPKLDWKFENGGDRLRLHVKSDQKPTQIVAWSAHTENRDFRPAEFASQPMQANGDGFVYEMEIPKQGTSAMFGEVVFGNDAFPLFLSTNIRLVGPAIEADAGAASK